MAEDSEDDGIEDTGAPPVLPGMRVWSEDQVERAASAPPTAEERAHFGIPDKPAVRPQAARVDSFVQEHPPLSAVGNPVVMALVAKFPDFQPSWPEATQTAWFNAFTRLMEAGLR